MVVGRTVAVGRLTSKYFFSVKGGGTLMYRMYRPT
jgi:hypothetical protein